MDNLSKSPTLTSLVDDLPGYTERSPSGDGLHAIGYGRKFKALGSNSSGVEAYSEGRYFTVTGDGARRGKIVCIADHVEQVLAPLHSRKLVRQDNSIDTRTVVLDPATVADLRSALLFLRADDYNLWISNGIALKSLSDVGRGLWMEWSATSEKFDAAEASRKWETFQADRTHYRSIFKRAQEAGWRNPLAKVPVDTTAITQINPAYPLAWTEAFMLTKEEADAISDPVWIDPGFIVQGHLIAVVSAPNGGKTTIFLHLAGRWAKKGHVVYYVNADTSASDAKRMVRQAEQDGFQLLLPDMKAGRP